MKSPISLDGSWHGIVEHPNRGRILAWQHRENFHGYHGIAQAAVPAGLEEFRQDYEGGSVGFALELGDLLHVDPANASPPRHSRPWSGPPWGAIRAATSSPVS